MAGASLKDIIKLEYQRCAGDPIYFMKKYCYIQHPKRGRIQFNLYQFQEKVLTLFQENIANILSNQFSMKPQKDFESERGTSIHYRNEISDIKRIDLSWDKAKVERHIRATYMPGFEPPYTMIGNEKVYFSTTWNAKK